MRRSLVLLLALSAACGKSDSEKFADEYCGEVAKCCAQASLPGDGKVCHQWYSLADAMGGAYDSKAGNACLTEMRTQVGAGTFCANLNSSSSSCSSVMGAGGGGSKKPGETCEFDSDCAPSSEGEISCESAYVNSAFIYKCQIQMPGKAGDSPCVGTQDGIIFMGASDETDVPPKGYVCNVADGLRCKTGACTAMPKIGEACDFGNDCARDGYCDYAADKCVARIAPGGTCTGSNSDECAAGSYCPTSGSKQCTTKLATGANCTGNAECQSDTCANGSCTADTAFGLSLMCGSP